MKIKKKIWPKYFHDIINGKKDFEMRLANFKCKPGDTLILREWDPKNKKYTGRIIKKKVEYVLKTQNLTFWEKKDIEKHGYQVIGFK